MSKCIKTISAIATNLSVKKILKKELEKLVTAVDDEDDVANIKSKQENE